jgi:DNA repair protein RecO (recombination protein O)
MRGQLLSFQPVEIGWVKGSELGQLRSVDWAGRFRPLAGLRLMCGFYLNELLLRLLPRDDPHERLFTDYGIALDRLADSGEDPSTVLRRFERRLLAELGYDPPFEREAANGTAIEPDARYRYDPERGPLRSAAGQGSIAGQTLIDMAADDYRSERTRAEAKELMRELIAHRCGSQKLHSREILKELLDL